MPEKLYKPILIDSIKAPVDIEKHRFIGFDGNYCLPGKKALGISDVSTEKEQYLPYSVLGILLVEAGGNISAGDDITSSDNGKAVVTKEADKINGTALDSAVTGEIIRIIRGI